MKKKQLKFKIYQHECVDCGWKIWRDYPIEEGAICSACESTNPPTITEDELIREIVINESYTPEEYENAKRIAQEIVDGKPLEEIEGLNLGRDMKTEPLLDCYVGGGSAVIPALFMSIGFFHGSYLHSFHSGKNLENNYY